MNQDTKINSISLQFLLFFLAQYKRREINSGPILEFVGIYLKQRSRFGGPQFVYFLCMHMVPGCIDGHMDPLDRMQLQDMLIFISHLIFLWVFIDLAVVLRTCLQFGPCIELISFFDIF
jgi:hypothetical protein